MVNRLLDFLLIVAVVVLKLPGENVLLELDHGLPVAVQPLHPPGQAAARRQVEVLHRGAVLQHPGQGLHADGGAAQV